MLKVAHQRGGGNDNSEAVTALHQSLAKLPEYSAVFPAPGAPRINRIATASGRIKGERNALYYGIIDYFFTSGTILFFVPPWSMAMEPPLVPDPLPLGACTVTSTEVLCSPVPSDRTCTSLLPVVTVVGICA